MEVYYFAGLAVLLGACIFVIVLMRGKKKAEITPPLKNEI